MAFKAWDGIEYQSEPPEGWYLASDGLWWSPGAGPGPRSAEPPGPLERRPAVSTTPPPPAVSDRVHRSNVAYRQFDIRNPYPPNDPEAIEVSQFLGLPDGLALWPIVRVVQWDHRLEGEPRDLTEFGLMPVSDRLVLVREFDALVASLPLRELVVAAAEFGSQSFLLLRNRSTGRTLTFAGHRQFAMPLSNLLVGLGAVGGPKDLRPSKVARKGSHSWPL